MPNQKEPPRIQFDLHHCTLAPLVLNKVRENIDSLLRRVVHFPITDVHILIERNNRSNEFTVKVSLILPGETLVGQEHDPAVHAALDRCLIGVEENIQAYKDRLGQVPARHKAEKGTTQEVAPAPPPDPDAIDQAVREADYAAFRLAAFGYEEPLRKRVGRWVERYPEVAARIGRRLEIADIVEEVFLLAFENYGSRPRAVRLGDWLETLLDPAVKTLQQHTDEELENISLLRSARVAEQGPDAI